jgi:hypothetical protein
MFSSQATTLPRRPNQKKYQSSLDFIKTSCIHIGVNVIAYFLCHAPWVNSYRP